MHSNDSKARRFNRGRSLLVGTAAALVVCALAVQAEPIQDGALAPYRAAWFDNTGPQAKLLSCTDTCRAKAPGTVAEHAPSAASVFKRAFVCRVQGKPNGNLQTWFYGSQFDSRPACYTTGLDLKGSHTDRYFCLCVVK